MVLLEITVYGYGEAPLLNIQGGCFFYLPLLPELNLKEGSHENHFFEQSGEAAE